MQSAFLRIVPPDGTVYDVGAHAGFFTLLASQLVGPGGRVVAFEPDPGNRSYLERHIRLNRVGNVTIVDAAVSDRTGIGSLMTHPGGTSMSYLSPEGGTGSQNRGTGPAPGRRPDPFSRRHQDRRRRA